MTSLPVKYRVEFYTNDDHPVFTIYPATPLFSYTVGDTVEPRAWPVQLLPTENYQVRAVEHICSVVSDEEILDSLSIYLERVPRPTYVVFKPVDGRTLILSRYTEPEPHHQAFHPHNERVTLRLYVVGGNRDFCRLHDVVP